MLINRNRTTRLASCAALALAAGNVHAAFRPVYGGLTYDSSTQTGYLNGSIPFTAASPGAAVNASGVAVGSARLYINNVSNGWRPVRWNTTNTPIVLTNLGNAANGDNSAGVGGMAINAAGVSVGYAEKYVGGITKGTRATRWDINGNVIEMGNLGANSSSVTSSIAYAINASGTSAGYAEKYVTTQTILAVGVRATRWDSTGAVTELALTSTNSSGFGVARAYAINDSGMAGGFARLYTGDISGGDRPARWDAAGAVTELGNLGTNTSGATTGSVYAINPTGIAAGYVQKYVSGSFKGERAVTWDLNGTITELANLGTDAGGTSTTDAFAINASGTSVGRAVKYVGGVSKGQRGVRWDATGAVTELITLGTSATGVTQAQAWGILDSGAAIGYASLYVGGVDQGDRAVYWNPDGTVVDLNNLIDPSSGWLLQRAQAISDTNDWIAGYGLYDPDGAGSLPAYQRTFVMQAPEPSSAILLLTATSAALLRRRQRRQAQTSAGIQTS